jgi:hypothetical protein
MSRIGSPRTWSAVARRSRLAVPAAAIAALVALLLRITLARHPWEGWSAGLSVSAGALALFAVWTLASSHWSGAPGRALLEFDRTLLYLAAFVLFGLVAARAGDLAVVLRWTAAAACGVCLVALATRLAPGSFPTDRPPSHTRFEFPLTYGVAVTQALAGQDPTAAIATAHPLNPREWRARDLQRAVRAQSRAKRARAAGRAPIPFD